MPIRTSQAQDRAFATDLLGDSLLEEALAWIAKEFEPEDVFEVSELEEWARNNNFIHTDEVER